MNSPLLYPRVSAIDPSLQFSLPETQTVYGGIDIMAHVLERVLDGDEGVELVEEPKSRPPRARRTTTPLSSYSANFHLGFLLSESSNLTQ